ncbi:hypothetical protein DB346_20630 [Verrucomicrobia bacterium LW23]|nr:hypothetical protein DB346_20630 [Verrucomicrobia bacterium LW23]
MNTSDNMSQQRQAKDRDPADTYHRLVKLARRAEASSESSHADKAPPFFAARVMARVQAQRKVDRVKRVSPWEIVGWKAVWASLAVVALVSVWAGPDALAFNHAPGEIDLFTTGLEAIEDARFSGLELL